MKKIFFINVLIVLNLYGFSQQALNVQNTAYQYPLSLQVNDIVGSWSLALRTFDDNKNGKLEEGRTKKGRNRQTLLPV
jgi:hypothetical protein